MLLNMKAWPKALPAQEMPLDLKWPLPGERVLKQNEPGAGSARDRVDVACCALCYPCVKQDGKLGANRRMEVYGKGGISYCRAFETTS